MVVFQDDNYTVTMVPNPSLQSDQLSRIYASVPNRWGTFSDNISALNLSTPYVDVERPYVRQYTDTYDLERPRPRPRVHTTAARVLPPRPAPEPIHVPSYIPPPLSSTTYYKVSEPDFDIASSLPLFASVAHLLVHIAY